ncbi:uncharacterized protein LOC101454665 [Ceratitis capitata]|nr:uncharacterized protein LOC101454665 [Ceratitis capitata]
MFWLCSVSLSLLDYRLIAINALIYDLIAAEIVHAATAVTEFDKSATRMQTMRGAATPKTITAVANGLWQRQDALEMSTAMNNNKTAELTFFGTKVSVDESDGAESSMNNSNSNNNRRKNNNTSESNNRISNPQTSIADGEVIASTITAVATAAIPSDLITADSNRRNENKDNNNKNNNNNISIMATVNERVDNFRNDKKQTKRQIDTKVERTIAAKTVAYVARTTTTTTTTTSTTATETTNSQGRTIAAKVITAIKSPAMNFLTSVLPTKITTATKIKLETHAAKVKSAESATAAASETSVVALKSVTALAAIPKTITTKATHATTPWPTLPSHDLLSSTNGLPNCRGILEFALDIGECLTKTNNNHTRTTTAIMSITTATAESTFAQSSTATTTITTLSTSSSSSLISTSTSTLSPITTLSTAKLQPETSATTTTHVTANLTGVKLSPSSASNNHTKHTVYMTTKNTVNATPMKSSAIKRSGHRQHPVPAVPWISTTPTTATNNTMRILRNAATATTKLTTALQSQWQRILSRRKRYLAFPEGASFTVSLCITVGIVGNPNYSYMSFGINWGLAYDLPNATWVLNQLHGLYRRPLPMAVHHRRSKRAIYERIGEAVDNMGYNGRECVLRALCESRQYFTRHKMGMIGEILRVIFSLPKQRLFTRELHENSDIAVYDHAYRQARSLDCAGQFDCSFSLLELAFGRYSKPQAEFYDGMNM